MDILEECKGAKNIGISGHVRPDGDCVGSTVGLYNYLNKALPNTNIDILLEKPACIFSCIKGVEEIRSNYNSEKIYDIFFALDCSTTDRLGDAEKCFFNAKKTIVIDHHISNIGIGDVQYIDPNASSTSELIAELVKKDFMDVEIAKALYIGIIHDTGVFQYSNTTPKTLTTAANLITYGFEFNQIIDDTFYKKTYLQNQIMGRALLESFCFMDGKCIVSSVDQKTMDFYGAVPKDLDGIVNQLRITKGVECAIFMYETNCMEYKVSMRSNGVVNVAEIASLFGGGGHIKAAGCTMTGTFHDVINNLSGYIAKQLGGEKKSD